RWWRRYCRCRPRGRRLRFSISPGGSRRESRRAGMRSAREGARSSLCQWKLRKLSVHGTAGPGLAAIEKEAARFEAAEIGRRQLDDGFAKRLKVGPFLDTGKGEVG